MHLPAMCATEGLAADATADAISTRSWGTNSYGTKQSITWCHSITRFLLFSSKIFSFHVETITYGAYNNEIILLLL